MIPHVHDWRKPYQCLMCDDTFSQNQTLKKHIDVVHDGKKLHLCSMCGYSAAAKNTLNLFMKERMSL